MPLAAPWAVIVAKNFGRAKSRLGRALSIAQRRELARAMFERVLDACARTAELAGTLVATDGDDAAALALRGGAHVLRDPEEPAALHVIVDRALEHARGLGASHALVVMADLPLLRARELRELLELLRSADVVVAPDAERRGTGALALRLDLGLRTGFGRPDSLRRHVDAAIAASASLRVAYSPRLALDLDAPQHIARLERASARPTVTLPRAGVAAPRLAAAPAR